MATLGPTSPGPRPVYGVDRSTVSAAIRQIRPLLGIRGFATVSGQRLLTLADVVAYAAPRSQRPAGRHRDPGPQAESQQPGRRAFVSGKKEQNTIKATIASDAHGRPLWVGAIRPGRQQDQAAARTEGIDDLLDAYPTCSSLSTPATEA